MCVADIVALDEGGFVEHLVMCSRGGPLYDCLLSSIATKGPEEGIRVCWALLLEWEEDHARLVQHERIDCPADLLRLFGLEGGGSHRTELEL